VIASGAVPVFLSVLVCGALEVPTLCEPKLRLAGVRLTAGAVPTPLSAMVCGLFGALSVIETLALRLPVAVGAKSTEIVQLAFAARVAGLMGQSLFCAKSPALVPVTPMIPIAKGALPEFVSVEVSTALVVPTRCDPKLRVPGLRPTAGAVAAPTPLRPRLCGLSPASSPMLTLAVLDPVAVGANRTEIVHVAFTASVAGLSGQSPVCSKSLASAPTTAMPVMARAAVPEFLSVAVCTALVVPTTCGANANEVGVRATAGAVPVPLSCRLCGLSPASSAIVKLAPRFPVADGENVTEIVQVASTGSVAGASGQSVVWA
jgi:hypothetical protein